MEAKSHLVTHEDLRDESFCAALIFLSVGGLPAWRPSEMRDAGAHLDLEWGGRNDHECPDIDHPPARLVSTGNRRIFGGMRFAKRASFN